MECVSLRDAMRRKILAVKVNEAAKRCMSNDLKKCDGCTYQKQSLTKEGSCLDSLLKDVIEVTEDV